MISRFFFLLGLVLCAFGAAQFGYDAVAGLESRGLMFWELPFSTAGNLWFDQHPQSLQISQAVIQRYIHPLIWDPVIQWILLQPAFAVSGLPGVVMLWLSSRKTRRHQQRFKS